MSEFVRTSRSAAPNWKPAITEFCWQLEREYQSKVTRFAKGIDCWGSSTTVGFAIPLGRGRTGPVWGDHVRYAKRVGFLGIIGRRVQLRDLDDVGRQFRREIDEWLAKRENESRESD